MKNISGYKPEVSTRPGEVKFNQFGVQQTGESPPSGGRIQGDALPVDDSLTGDEMGVYSVYFPLLYSQFLSSKNNEKFSLNPNLRDTHDYAKFDWFAGYQGKSRWL